MYLYTKVSFNYFKKMLAIGVSALFMAGFIFALAAPVKAQTFNLKVKIVDELNLSLLSSTPPVFTVDNCSATAPRIEATRALGDGVFELAIVVDGSDQNCDLKITSNQYLHTLPIATGDLSAGYQDKSSTPITVYYRLRVLVKNNTGDPVTDAVVHHAGFSPQRASGGIYYFATSANGALLIERTGFVTENGSQNTQLQNVFAGTNTQATVIESSGETLCAASNSVLAGSSVTCARLNPTLVVEAKDPSGNLLNDATVRVYTDLARTNLANDYLTSGTGDAQKTTNGTGRASFALTSGRYYVRVERFGYNDANPIVDVPGTSVKTETAVLSIAGANIVSPGKSQATISPTTLTADGVSLATLTVKARDGNNDVLGRRSVTVKSTRTEDTITPATGLTNNDGNVVFNITSSKHGESTYTITIETTIISTFPKVNWTVSAAALASPTPSASESKVEASVSPVASNGEATVTVTVKNEGGATLSGKLVTLTSSRPAEDTITPQSATTNASGQATFSVKSSVAGTSIISVDAAGVTLNEMAIITFSPAGRFTAGMLLKSAENPAVYYYGKDGKRHGFPNEKVYKSWYADFSTVQTVSAEDLASVQLGSNVTYRPGVKMIKVQSVPKVYAIAKGRVLRWIKTEELARSLYGTDWNKKIDDVSDALFTNYLEGADINSSSDYNPSAETASAPTIDDTM